MYAITYKGFPVTRERLAIIMGKPFIGWPYRTGQGYIAARTKQDAINFFKCDFQGPWTKKKKGIECEKVTVTKRQKRHNKKNADKRRVIK